MLGLGSVSGWDWDTCQAGTGRRVRLELGGVSGWEWEACQAGTGAGRRKEETDVG